jgi:Tol biopolymer transport system component
VRRAIPLALLLLTGVLLISMPRASDEIDRRRLTWVATAQQYGPVGYRDPAGAISPDGRWIAYSEGRFVRVRPIGGGPDLGLPPGDAQIRRLAWTSTATILTDGPAGAWARFDRVRRTREALSERPAFDEPKLPRLDPAAAAFGPFAASPDRGTIYFAAPYDGGATVDLSSVPAAGGRPRRLTSFSRDTYAPSVAADGTVLFKVQSYRTVVARAPADGGATEPLADFQSETPSWHHDGTKLGITYGSWRRVIDDAKYPDIAQEAGIIDVGSGGVATTVSHVVDESPSEDQSLCWSPNGKWIAYHSHKEESDDIWLRRAEGNDPATRISHLGRGAEAGWPRWSPDGRSLSFTAIERATGQDVLYVLGIDQERGAVTSEARVLPIRGHGSGVFHAEWVGKGETLVGVAKEGPGRHVIFTVPREGGDARIVHRFASEHDVPGLGVSPDGAHVAFVAPAPDGYFQIFRMPIAGGPAVQVTRDPSHKTQPAWSPDGRTIALTVWSYEAQFWTMKPG